MIIPYEKLSEEALTGLMDDFILREGTEYGETEYSLEEKRLQIISQLKKEQVVITYDPSTETCTLLTREAYRNIRKHSEEEEEE